MYDDLQKQTVNCPEMISCVPIFIQRGDTDK